MKDYLKALLFSVMLLPLLFSCDSLMSKEEVEPQVFLATFQHESSPWPDTMVTTDAAVSTVSDENPTAYAGTFSADWKTGFYEGDEFITCFRYNIGLTVPVDATITKVILKFPSAQIRVTDISTPLTLNMYGMRNVWSVEYTNWNDIMNKINEDQVLGSITLYDDASSIRNISVDIPIDTSYVQSWLSSPNLGMVLRAETNETGNNYLNYFGNQYSNTYMRPMLMVYYTL